MWQFPNNLEKAEAAWKSRHYEQAIALSTKAIQLDPDSLPAYEVRIMAYTMTRQYGHAISDAAEIIRLKPNSSLAYAIRAEAYRMKGKNNLAISDANEAIRLNPNSAMAYETKRLSDRALAMTVKPAFTARAGVYHITAADVEYEAANRNSDGKGGLKPMNSYMEFLKDYMKTKREKEPDAQLTYAEIKTLKGQFGNSCLAAVRENGAGRRKKRPITPGRKLSQALLT